MKYVKIDGKEYSVDQIRKTLDKDSCDVVRFEQGNVVRRNTSYSGDYVIVCVGISSDNQKNFMLVGIQTANRRDDVMYSLESLNSENFRNEFKYLAKNVEEYFYNKNTSK